jgi:hypothetical protein
MKLGLVWVICIHFDLQMLSLLKMLDAADAKFALATVFGVAVCVFLTFSPP